MLEKAGIQAVIFLASIGFENHQMPGTTALYSGNISEIETVQRGNPKDIYAYSYDGLSRLTDAGHFIGGPAGASNTNTERFMEYDLNGNRTSDGRTALEFTYNLLNLPCEVRNSQDVMQMRYTYLDDGTKVSALNAAGDGMLYRGNLLYQVLPEDDPFEIGDTLAVIDTLPGLPWNPGRPFIPTLLEGEGQTSNVGVAELVFEPALERAALYQDQWFVRDHLGNVRSVIDLTRSATMPADSVILEQNDYLPYGTKSSTSSLSTDSAFRYRYAGKEEQRFGTFDSQLLDFGARCYDPWSCQWTAVDPIAEKYYAMTPYGYCAEVPIKYYDPNGTYVAIQYQQNGKTYSYIFNGTGKLMPKNSFVQAFVEAYSSNKENWARAGLPGDSPTTELVERSDFKVTIKQTIGGSVEYVQENGGTPVIYWDPFRGSKGNTGIVRSPASVLAHESDHAVDDLTNAKAHSDRRDKENQKNEGCRKISNILHSC